MDFATEAGAVAVTTIITTGARGDFEPTFKLAGPSVTFSNRQ
jgi:hypothetical protein